MSEATITLFTNMAVLFLVMVAGYAAKKVKWITPALDKGLSKVVLNVTLPAMLVASALDAESLPSLDQIGFAIFACVGMYAVLIVLAFALTFVLRIHPGNQGVFRYMTVFANIGFVGIPIAQVLYGNEAVVYAGIFQLPFGLLVYTLGVYFLMQDNAYLPKSPLDESASPNSPAHKNAGALKDGKLADSIESATASVAGGMANGSAADKKSRSFSWRAIITPALVASIATLIFVLAGVHAVPVIGPATTMLGQATTPMALIIVGSSLAGMPLRDLLGGPRLWICSAVRLIAAPLLVWVIFRMVITDPVVLGVLVVLSGMPVAINGTMFTYEYGGNTKTMAQGTFITTLFSLATIPLVMMLTGL